MNFFFNEVPSSPPKPAPSIMIDTAEESERNSVDQEIETFVKEKDIHDVDLTSSDAKVAADSKRAIILYIEQMMEKKRKQGLSSDEILNDLSTSLFNGGGGDVANKFSKETINNFIEAKRAEINRVEREANLKFLTRDLKEKEKDMLESLKTRADSTALDDRYIPSNSNDDKTDYSSPEFTTLSYTPVCCDGPGTYMSDGYKIRCLREAGRRPRVMVVITMYNEPPEQLRATLRSVGNNIRELQQREQRLPGFGLEVWKDVCVCIVSDGRTKVKGETLDWLANLGMYQDNRMQFKVDSTNEHGEEVLRGTTMHLFERTVLLDKEKKNRRMGRKNTPTTDNNKSNKDANVVQLPPMQLMFALKEKNAQKLNSHYWFFEAFCKEIEPDYCIMLDVGTMPTHNAFSLLLTEMATNKQIGGTCGEIVVDEPYSNVLNWVKLAQHFEYKVSNFLDKAHESAFGYISVLPGAFSAYRYAAIQGTPIQRYFEPLIRDVEDMGPFKGNMYLAEDRILCIEILIKKGEHWTMSYVKDARARTDVPDDLNSLILQRRRWINGSFFASLYALTNYYRVFTESSHDSLRKVALFFLLIYQWVVFLTSWFQIALFILTIYFVAVDGVREGTVPLVDGSLAPDMFYSTFMGIYGCVLISQLVFALGNKIRFTRFFYMFLCMWYGIIMVTVLAFTLMIFITVDPDEVGGIFVVVSACLSLGVIFAGALLHGELHHIALTTVQYLVLLPVLVNVLTMYSMSNLHDLSWGTKGLQEVELKNKDLKIDRMRGQLGSKYQNLDPEDVEFLAKEQEQRLVQQENDKREKRFTQFRTNMLLFYMSSQFLLIFVIVSFVPANNYFQFFAAIVGGINGFKFLGSLYFLTTTQFKRMRFWFFLKFGWRACLCFNSEEMERKKDIIEKQNQGNLENNMAHIDNLFTGEHGSNLLFVKEEQSEGYAVRETSVNDRAFYSGRV